MWTLQYFDADTVSFRKEVTESSFSLTFKENVETVQKLSTIEIIYNSATLNTSIIQIDCF